MKEAKDSTLYCSFCGKNKDETRNLIAGPNVFICNECVHLCQEMVDAEADCSDLKDLKGDGRIPIFWVKSPGISRKKPPESPGILVGV